MAIPEWPPLPCPDCHGQLVLQYNPTKTRDRHPYIYRCTNATHCGGKVAAHPDGKPMGIPAPAYVRKLRNQCHKAFDHLWLNIHNLPSYSHVFGKPNRNDKEKHSLRQSARERAYCYMAYRLGMDDPEDVHLGQITSPAILREFMRIASEATCKRVDKWWREEGKKLFPKRKGSSRLNDDDIADSYDDDLEVDDACLARR